MLTSLILETGRESHDEVESDHRPPERGMSTSSNYTCSNASVASTADLTSDGFTSPTRTNTPSPPLPPSIIHALPPCKPLEPQQVMVHEPDSVAPPHQVSASLPSENNVELGLGRKRCIKFACGGKDSPSLKPQNDVQPPPEQVAEPPKRRCMIKWANSCVSTDKADKPAEARRSSMPRRPASPAPNALKDGVTSQAGQPRVHRDSDATVRNDSGRRVKKSSSVSSIVNTRAKLDLPPKALTFHEFASSGTEDDEWTRESTCHRSRLTIDDTLKVENRLRRLGEEAEEEEEEAMEDEEALDNEIDEDGGEDVDEDDGDDVLESVKDDVYSDDGFQTDDEDGFAGSDDEDSDADSDYRWWEPTRSAATTTRTSYDSLEFVRPRAHRSMSESSVASSSAIPAPNISPPKGKKFKRPRPLDIHPQVTDLPDSTDFVCGTLDEDRPLEEAYLSQLERRRAAKHKVTPQDFDPTFPHSDPEIDDEEDDDDVTDENAGVAEESDQHFFVHGSMQDIDVLDLGPAAHRRSPSPRRTLRSPMPPALRSAGIKSPPARLRSPPPIRHRSPPLPSARKLFGTSPRRLRSPPPTARLHSPPPTRRTSVYGAVPGRHIQIQLAERPRGSDVASSLPRVNTAMNPGFAPPSRAGDEEDECQTPMRIRGAIDIVKGLEKKKQLRRQKLYQKICNKPQKERRGPATKPGTGAEKMRAIGMECKAHKIGQTGFGLGGPLKRSEGRDVYMASL